MKRGNDLRVAGLRLSAGMSDRLRLGKSVTV